MVCSWMHPTVKIYWHWLVSSKKMFSRTRRTLFDTTCFSRQGQLRERIKIYIVFWVLRGKGSGINERFTYRQTDIYVDMDDWLWVSLHHYHIILLNFTCYVSTAINHISPLIIIIPKTLDHMLAVIITFFAGFHIFSAEIHAKFRKEKAKKERRYKAGWFFGKKNIKSISSRLTWVEPVCVWYYPPDSGKPKADIIYLTYWVRYVKIYGFIVYLPRKRIYSRKRSIFFANISVLLER